MTQGLRSRAFEGSTRRAFAGLAIAVAPAARYVAEAFRAARAAVALGDMPRMPFRAEHRMPGSPRAIPRGAG